MERSTPESETMTGPIEYRFVNGQKKFWGTYADLKVIVARVDLPGRWHSFGNHRMYRADSGAILNWWESTGTINFQGPAAAAEEFDIRFNTEASKASTLHDRSDC
jgi:hypothetical protein